MSRVVTSVEFFSLKAPVKDWVNDFEFQSWIVSNKPNRRVEISKPGSNEHICKNQNFYQIATIGQRQVFSSKIVNKWKQARWDREWLKNVWAEKDFFIHKPAHYDKRISSETRIGLSRWQWEGFAYWWWTSLFRRYLWLQDASLAKYILDSPALPHTFLRSATRTESIKVSAEPRWQFIILNDDWMQIQRDQQLKALRRQGCDVNATSFVRNRYHHLNLHSNKVASNCRAFYSAWPKRLRSAI